jgi:hypothetical protein
MDYPNWIDDAQYTVYYVNAQLCGSGRVEPWPTIYHDHPEDHGLNVTG